MRRHARLAGAGYPGDYAEVIRLLAEAGADVESRVHAIPTATALMVAAAHNFVPSVRALLVVGANVNAVNEVSWSTISLTQTLL